MPSIFPILMINARPAAGKSEIIHYLNGLPLKERMERYHIGEMRVFDDFPMLWEWFEEDRILEHEFSLPRLHTTPDEYFLKQEYWHLLIRRLGLEYQKWLRDAKSGETALIEFSRGKEHGGYRAAYQHLGTAILSRAACLYVNVSFEESLRKNRRRFNPDRPNSILEHGLDEGKLRRLYVQDDWSEYVGGSSGYLAEGKHRLPYVVFDNEDDITTVSCPQLGKRLQRSLGLLWELWHKLHGSGE